MITKGWDTVCLVKCEHINQDIENSWHLFDVGFVEIDAGCEIRGEFAPWQIHEGGSNKFVVFKIPFESGTFTIFNNNSENDLAEYDLSGCHCIVKMEMAFVKTNDNKELLKLNIKRFARTVADITDDDCGYITPISCIGDGLTTVSQNIIGELLCNYLIKYPDQIAYIFASINLAQNDDSWVAPVKSIYSYLDSDPSYMGVLSVCSNRDISNLPVDIDVPKFNDNSNSYFVISPDYFLLNVIVPSLIDFFQNSSESDYMINSLGILENTRNLEMKSVKSGAIWYTPIVTKINVFISGNMLCIDIDGKCDLYAGIWMYFNGGYNVHPVLENDIIELKICETPSFEYHEDIPWYLSWLILVVWWIVEIIVSCISNDLMKSITNVFGDIMCNNISPVSWTDNPEDVTLKKVEFDESFIMEYLID